MSKFVFNELHTKDAAAAQKFYEGVFGWSFNSMPMPNGDYIFIKADGDGIGGIVQEKKGSPYWLSYVGVPSVKRAINKATGRGGKVVMGFTKIPNMGCMAILKDPTGAVFAVWEDAAKKPAAKKTTAKKTVAKKATAKKKTVAKKATAKKTVAKKTTRKAAPQKRVASAAAKKAASKKRAAVREAAAKRAATRKTSRGKKAAK